MGWAYTRPYAGNDGYGFRHVAKVGRNREQPWSGVHVMRGRGELSSKSLLIYDAEYYSASVCSVI